MKKSFGLVAVVALAMTVGFSAMATEVRLMSWAVNESNAKNDQAAYKKDIATNGIDLAIFEWCKASSYFISGNFEQGGLKYSTCCRLYGVKNNYKYAICAEDYQLLNDPTNSTYLSSDSMAAIFKDKYDDVYAFINLRSNSAYKDSNVASVGDYLTQVMEAHPGARLFVSYNERPADLPPVSRGPPCQTDRFCDTIIPSIQKEKENTMAGKLEERVKNIIVEQLGVNAEQVTTEASFIDDLGADSLDSVELIMAFEEAFGAAIPEEDAEKLTTVGKVVDYLKSKGYGDEA